MTWALTYPLVKEFGYIGVGIASALVASTSLGTIYFVKKQLPIKVGSNVLGPLLVSIVMFASLKYFFQITSTSFPALILAIIMGAVIYLVSSLAIFRKSLIDDALVIINSIINKK